MTEEQILEIGHIIHMFPRISVAIVQLTAPLSVGDQILVKGPSTDFGMAVSSMQVEHKALQRAEAGQTVGLKLDKPAKQRDIVYKKL